MLTCSRPIHILHWESAYVGTEIMQISAAPLVAMPQLANHKVYKRHSLANVPNNYVDSALMYIHVENTSG